MKIFISKSTRCLVLGLIIFNISCSKLPVNTVAKDPFIELSIETGDKLWMDIGQEIQLAKSNPSISEIAYSHVCYYDLPYTMYLLSDKLKTIDLSKSKEFLDRADIAARFFVEKAIQYNGNLPEQMLFSSGILRYYQNSKDESQRSEAMKALELIADKSGFGTQMLNIDTDYTRYLKSPSGVRAASNALTNLMNLAAARDNNGTMISDLSSLDNNQKKWANILADNLINDVDQWIHPKYWITWTDPEHYTDVNHTKHIERRHYITPFMITSFWGATMARWEKCTNSSKVFPKAVEIGLYLINPNSRVWDTSTKSFFYINCKMQLNENEFSEVKPTQDISWMSVGFFKWLSFRSRTDKSYPYLADIFSEYSDQLLESGTNKVRLSDSKGWNENFKFLWEYEKYTN